MFALVCAIFHQLHASIAAIERELLISCHALLLLLSLLSIAGSSGTYLSSAVKNIL